MNTQIDRNMQADIDTDLLKCIEGAVTQRTLTGHADEARYGFVARITNATPPTNESFRQALRARIVAEPIARARKASAASRRVRPVRSWRLAFATGLAALAILAAAFAVFQRPGVLEPGTAAHTPSFTPSPQLASRDVDALAQRLNDDPDPRTVVVFPGTHAGTLAKRVQHQVVPLLLSADQAPAALRAALGAALPPSGLVDVIIIAQDTPDLTHQVRVALEQHLYRLYRPGETGTEAFGELERHKFAVGPQDVTLEPVGATFENGVELVAAGVLDDPRPGELLRVALDWRVAEPVDDSLVMFVHLVYDENRVVAQRDAVPGNGLFPVENWEPGELVRDQFALLLPLELPAGQYQVQVGIYSATTGQRYTVIGPEEGPYVVVQQVTVEDTGQGP